MHQTLDDLMDRSNQFRAFFATRLLDPTSFFYKYRFDTESERSPKRCPVSLVTVSWLKAHEAIVTMAMLTRQVKLIDRTLHNRNKRSLRRWMQEFSKKKKINIRKRRKAKDVRKRDMDNLLNGLSGMDVTDESTDDSSGMEESKNAVDGSMGIDLNP